MIEHDGEQKPYELALGQEVIKFAQQFTELLRQHRELAQRVSDLEARLEAHRHDSGTGEPYEPI